MCHNAPQPYTLCQHKPIERKECDDWKAGRPCKQRWYHDGGYPPIDGFCPACQPKMPVLHYSRTEPVAAKISTDFVTEWEQQTGGQVRVLDGRRAETWSSTSSSRKDRQETTAIPEIKRSDTRAAEIWNSVTLATIQERSEGSESTGKGKDKEKRISAASKNSDEGGFKGKLKDMFSLGRKKSSGKNTKDLAISTAAADRYSKESEKKLSPPSPRAPIELIHRGPDGFFQMSNQSQNPDQFRDPDQSRWSLDTDDRMPGMGVRKSLSNPPKAKADRYVEEPRTSAPELGQRRARDSGGRRGLEPSPLSTSLETGKAEMAARVEHRRIEGGWARSPEHGNERKDARRPGQEVLPQVREHNADRPPRSNGQGVEEPLKPPPGVLSQKRSIEYGGRPAAKPYPSHLSQQFGEYSTGLERSLSQPERRERERQHIESRQAEQPRGELDRKIQNALNPPTIPHSAPRVRRVQDVYPPLARSRTTSDVRTRNRIQAEATQVPTPRLQRQQTEGHMVQPRIEHERRNQDTKQRLQAPLSPRTQGQPSQEYPPSLQRVQPTTNSGGRERVQEEKAGNLRAKSEKRKSDGRLTMWPTSEPERTMQNTGRLIPAPLRLPDRNSRDAVLQKNDLTAERKNNERKQEENRKAIPARSPRPQNEKGEIPWHTLDSEYRSEEITRDRLQPYQVAKQPPVPTTTVDDYFGDWEDFEERKRNLKPEEQCGVDYPEKHFATKLDSIQNCSMNQDGNQGNKNTSGSARPTFGSVNTINTKNLIKVGNFGGSSSESKIASIAAGPICGGTKNGNNTLNTALSRSADGALNKAIRSENPKIDQEEKLKESLASGKSQPSGRDGDVRKGLKGVKRLPLPPVREVESQECRTSDEKRDRTTEDVTDISTRVLRFFPQKRKPLKDRKAKPTVGIIK